MNDKLLFEVEGLNIELGKRQILKKLCFSLGKGQFTAIIGPNGAGKTTLLKSLCGLLEPTSGKIQLEQKDLLSYHPKELARCLAYVPQGLAHIPKFRVKDFLLMNRYPYFSPLSVPKEEDFLAVQKAFTCIDIEDSATQFLPTLSGGELQKVLLAAALTQETSTLLLDEPATYLDPFYQRQIYQILGKLHHQGLNVIMVSHDLTETLRCTTHILALKEGGVFFYGTTQEFIQQKKMNELFGIDFVEVRHPKDGKIILI